MASKNAKQKQPQKHAKKRARSNLTFLAAAAVLCLVLCALMYFVAAHIQQSVNTSKQDSETVLSTDYSQLSVNVSLAMPTGVELEIQNPSNLEIAVPEKYVICQDGTQIAEGEGKAFSMERGNYLYRIMFPELPAGHDYTFSAVTEDGVSAGAFSEVPFAVSQDFDSMIWIPDVKGMIIDEAEPLLTEKGFIVNKNFSYSTIAEIAEGEIVGVSVPFKQISQTESISVCCYDGKGYWLDAGDQVILDINSPAS